MAFKHLKCGWCENLNKSLPCLNPFISSNVGNSNNFQQIKFKILNLAFNTKMSWPLPTTRSPWPQPLRSSFCLCNMPCSFYPQKLGTRCSLCREVLPTPTQKSSHVLLSLPKTTHFLGLLLFVPHVFTHSFSKCLLSPIYGPGVVLGAGKWQQRW